MRKWIYAFYYYCIFIREMMKTEGQKRLILIGTPWHGNLGDHAIVLAEKELLEAYFNDYKIIECPLVMIKKIFMICGLFTLIKKDDYIIVQGGGNLGSLYRLEEEIHRWTIKKFPNNHILFMPKSIFFANDDHGQKELIKSQEVYAQAKNLSIIERDELSYAKGQEYFPTAKHFLAPDVVTYLESIEEANANNRIGVCFVLRKDKERVLDDSLVERIKVYLHIHKIKFFSTDTSSSSRILMDSARQKHVWAKLRQISSAKLVITDRYHGAIFSFITHTPVIVFKSYDTKISEGIKWFNDVPWVHYAENMDIADIEKLIRQYCTDNVNLSFEFTSPKVILTDVITSIKEGEDANYEASCSK